jgi:hypothetical protein
MLADMCKYFFLLLFFTVTLGACESEFSLILTDQYGQKQTLVMDKSELNDFLTLKNLYESFGFCDQRVQEISPEYVSYEVFKQILKPFCLWSMEYFGDFLTDDPIKIALFKTGETIRYLHWKHGNEPDLVAAAYKAADFLQMPFEVKRAFINFLYDNKRAGSVVDESELTSNNAGYLISSKEFDELIYKEHTRKAMNWPSGNVFEDRWRVYFLYNGKGVRYFDPSSVSKERINCLGADLFYFNFTGNKIQDIDFDQLAANILTLADDFDVSERPIVDLRNNPLSLETKQKITHLVNENQDRIKKNLNILRLRRKNLERENKKKLLYLFVLKIITILGLSACLIPIRLVGAYAFSFLAAYAAFVFFCFYKEFQSSNYDYSRKLKQENRPEKKRAGVEFLHSAYLPYKGNSYPMPVYDNRFYIFYD